mmetsp:Transcript_33095/g.65674  ORF Transcript_33095/g.65674 Transcript_33095/m.65674 type:complete len:82 (+) Transcript_33095:65-310(+)
MELCSVSVEERKDKMTVFGMKRETCTTSRRERSHWRVERPREKHAERKEEADQVEKERCRQRDVDRKDFEKRLESWSLPGT